jgi:dGTP triphosphohydrolase
MPDNYLKTSQNSIERAVVDYIAGMTDHYAYELAKKLNLIRSL